MKLMYDIDNGSMPPQEGRFIASITQKGIGSIYHVVSSRKVNSKVHPNRYSVEVLPANDMKPVSEIKDGFPIIRGNVEYAIHWYSRNAK